tara:strand:+ start:2281 stop:2727 length:447 start_codon:yes stop_codon:yes gene_type:complete
MSIDLSLGDPFNLSNRHPFYLNIKNESNTSILSDVTFVLNDDEQFSFEDSSESNFRERAPSIITLSSSESNPDMNIRTMSTDTKNSSYNSLENISFKKTRSNQSISKNITKKKNRRKRDDSVFISSEHYISKTPTPIMFKELEKHFYH